MLITITLFVVDKRAPELQFCNNVTPEIFEHYFAVKTIICLTNINYCLGFQKIYTQIS